MDHAISRTDLTDHKYFKHEVRCTCGWAAYAVSYEQADDHAKFHESEIPRLEWLEAQAQAKGHVPKPILVTEPEANTKTESD